MATYIGVPIAEEKIVQPTQCIIFMGIELDSLLFEARLPQDKLQKCRALLREFFNQKSVTLRSLQSLIRVLNFASSVIVPGRTFLRRLIDLTIGVKQPYHHIKIKSVVKLDLTTWLEFLDNHNGINMFIDERWASSDKLRLYTDASGSIGYGGVPNHFLVLREVASPMCVTQHHDPRTLPHCSVVIHIWSAAEKQMCFVL